MLLQTSPPLRESKNRRRAASDWLKLAAEVTRLYFPIPLTRSEEGKDTDHEIRDTKEEEEEEEEGTTGISPQESLTYASILLLPPPPPPSMPMFQSWGGRETAGYFLPQSQ